MQLNQPTLGYLVDQNSAEIVYLSTYQIGDWNMDTTALKQVTTTILVADIRGMCCMIIADSSGSTTHLCSIDQAGNQGGFISSQDNNIVLYRVTGGFFDQANFDSTSFNRGFVQIWHV